MVSKKRKFTSRDEIHGRNKADEDESRGVG
jgi:hypothetical protein